MPDLALVTGGAHRLGKVFGLSLARMGFDILLHYHQAETLALETAREIRETGVQVHLVKADLTLPPQVDRIFSLIDSLGVECRFSVLVNSAAIMPQGLPLEIDVLEWNYTMDLNLRAPFLICQQAAKRMSSSGLMVNISDVGAQKTWSRYCSYAISKAGLETLTRILARELAPAVRVNAIAPGLVMPSRGISPDRWTTIERRLPLKRSASLNEITSALEFLVKNDYVTGQTIVVDGGYSLI